MESQVTIKEHVKKKHSRLTERETATDDDRHQINTAHRDSCLQVKGCRDDEVSTKANGWEMFEMVVLSEEAFEVCCRVMKHLGCCHNLVTLWTPSTRCSSPATRSLERWSMLDLPRPSQVPPPRRRGGELS